MVDRCVLVVLPLLLQLMAADAATTGPRLLLGCCGRGTSPGLGSTSCRRACTILWTAARTCSPPPHKTGARRAWCRLKSWHGQTGALCASVSLPLFIVPRHSDWSEARAVFQQRCGSL